MDDHFEEITGISKDDEIVDWQCDQELPEVAKKAAYADEDLMMTDVP